MLAANPELLGLSPMEARYRNNFVSKNHPSRKNDHNKLRLSKAIKSAKQFVLNLSVWWRFSKDMWQVSEPVNPLSLHQFFIWCQECSLSQASYLSVILLRKQPGRYLIRQWWRGSWEYNSVHLHVHQHDLRPWQMLAFWSSSTTTSRLPSGQVLESKLMENWFVWLGHLESSSDRNSFSFSGAAVEMMVKDCGTRKGTICQCRPIVECYLCRYDTITWQCEMTALVWGILSKSGSEVSAWLQGGTVPLRGEPTAFSGQH